MPSADYQAARQQAALWAYRAETWRVRAHAIATAPLLDIATLHAARDAYVEAVREQLRYDLMAAQEQPHKDLTA